MIRKFQHLLTFVAFASTLLAQTVIPDGTPVKLRLNEALSSARNQVGQAVSLTVAEDVVIGGQAVIESGTRAVGIITIAEHKKSVGRAGKLDFVPDKVQLSDGRMVSLRATPQAFHGKGKGITTGVVTAGIAVLFWPAAPLALLIKGKDVEIPPGATFTTFTDSKVILSQAAMAQIPSSPAPVLPMLAPIPAPQAMEFLPSAQGEIQGPSASVVVSADADSADIEVDGRFVGQTPATLNLAAGSHRIVVRSETASWERTMQLTGGNSINLKAHLQPRETNAGIVAQSH